MLIKYGDKLAVTKFWSIKLLVVNSCSPVPLSKMKLCFFVRLIKQIFCFIFPSAGRSNLFYRERDSSRSNNNIINDKVANVPMFEDYRICWLCKSVPGFRHTEGS